MRAVGGIGALRSKRPRRIRPMVGGPKELRALFAIIEDNDLALYKVEAAAGIGSGCLNGWKRLEVDPTLGSYVAVLQALGKKLAIVDMED